MTDDELDLLHSYLNGNLTPEETESLNQLLRSDAEARETLRTLATIDAKWRRVSARNLDVAMESGEFTERSRNFKSSWFSWRPLASAAAGIMFGVLTTSMVWSYSGGKILKPSRIAIPLVDPGFEKLIMPIPENLPRALHRWIGGPTHVPSSGRGSVKPKEGQSMLKVNPRDDLHYSRIEQIVEVGHLTPAEGGVVEFSAAFFCEGAEDKCKMTLVLRAFSLSGDEIAGTTEDLTELMTSQAHKKFTLSSGATNWQTGKMRMDLPPNTNTLVFEIATPDLPETSSTASQYIDDIKAAILVTDSPDETFRK